MPDGDRQQLAALFIHGWTGKSNDSAAAMLANHGFCAMTINLRGHNSSDGDIKAVSRRQSLADAVAAYDFLRQQLSPDVSIVAVGNSYGGYISALLSQERPLAALSLRVPANYPDEGFDQPQWGNGNDNPVVAKWRAQPLGPSKTRALRAIHNFQGRLQIFEAEYDERVHSQTPKNYRHAVADPSLLEYHLMRGWPHGLGDDAHRNKDFQSLLLVWLKKQV